MNSSLSLAKLKSLKNLCLNKTKVCSEDKMVDTEIFSKSTAI